MNGSVATTHAEAAIQLRRPFAPGAIQFRALGNRQGPDKVWRTEVAAYLSAHAIKQRLNAVVPGAWSASYHPVATELQAAEPDKLHLECRLAIVLPVVPNGPPTAAVYADVGDQDRRDPGSRGAPTVKAVYSDALKRAAASAGIATYLYTGQAKKLLGDEYTYKVRNATFLTEAAETLLRTGYRNWCQRPETIAAFGEMLAHGEPDDIVSGDPDEHAAADVVPAAPVQAAVAPMASVQALPVNGAATFDAPVPAMASAPLDLP